MDSMYQSTVITSCFTEEKGLKMRTYFKMDVGFDVEGEEMEASVDGFFEEYTYGNDADGRRGVQRYHMEFKIMDLEVYGMKVDRELWYDFENEVEEAIWDRLETDYGIYGGGR
jgi:hypothetical protein